MHSAILGGVAASATILLVVGYFIYRRRRKEYQVVGTVSRICLYPIKSCRGIDLQAAQCTTSGLQAQGLKDRYFMLQKITEFYLAYYNLYIYLISEPLDH